MRVSFFLSVLVIQASYLKSKSHGASLSTLFYAAAMVNNTDKACMA